MFMYVYLFTLNKGHILRFILIDWDYLESSVVRGDLPVEE